MIERRTVMGHKGRKCFMIREAQYRYRKAKGAITSSGLMAPGQLERGLTSLLSLVTYVYCYLFRNSFSTTGR